MRAKPPALNTLLPVQVHGALHDVVINGTGFLKIYTAFATIPVVMCEPAQAPDSARKLAVPGQILEFSARNMITARRLPARACRNECATSDAS